MGGLGISKEKNILKTFVGSCIALCIYDIEKKIGGMVHIMLPKNISKKHTKGTSLEGKYADEAIDILIEKLSKISPNLKLHAKMAGGATIFSHESDTDRFNVGNKNILEIRLQLQKNNIPLVSQLVGSQRGRWVTFDCNNQKVTVKESDHVEII